MTYNFCTYTHYETPTFAYITRTIGDEKKKIPLTKDSNRPANYTPIIKHASDEYDKHTEFDHLHGISIEYEPSN